MINKSKYTQTQAKKSLKTVKNIKGDIIDSTYTSTGIWKRRLVKTNGMNMCRKTLLFEALANTVKSNLEMVIISYMLTNQSSQSFVKDTNGLPATIQQIAKKFNTSDRKVRDLIARLESEDLVKRNSKRIYINPFIQLPFGNSEQNNFIVQLMWKHDYKHSEEELLQAHHTELEVDRTTEV